MMLEHFTHIQQGINLFNINDQRLPIQKHRELLIPLSFFKRSSKNAGLMYG